VPIQARMFARNGACTLAHNAVTVPTEPRVYTARFFFASSADLILKRDRHARRALYDGLVVAVVTRP